MLEEPLQTGHNIIHCEAQNDPFHGQWTFSFRKFSTKVSSASHPMSALSCTLQYTLSRENQQRVLSALRTLTPQTAFSSSLRTRSPYLSKEIMCKLAAISSLFGWCPGSFISEGSDQLAARAAAGWKPLCPYTFPIPCFTPSRPGTGELLSPQDRAKPLKPRHASHTICQCGIEKGQAIEVAALGKRSGRCQIPRTRKLSRVADFRRRFPSAPN